MADENAPKVETKDLTENEAILRERSKAKSSNTLPTLKDAEAKVEQL